MPFLMVNLDDPADCRRGWEQLAALLERGPGGPRGRGRCGPPPRQTGPHRHAGQGHRRPHGGPPPHDRPDLQDLPLMQKLRRIRPRGIWQYLHLVATQAPQPLSLPEIDEQLGLAKNKMRSLKAIMGKLERRWGIEFLIPDPAGSVDASGNPRYLMPPELRRKIIQLSD